MQTSSLPSLLSELHKLHTPRKKCHMLVHLSYPDSRTRDGIAALFHMSETKCGHVRGLGTVEREIFTDLMYGIQTQ